MASIVATLRSNSDFYGLISLSDLYAEFNLNSIYRLLKNEIVLPVFQLEYPQPPHFTKAGVLIGYGKHKHYSGSFFNRGFSVKAI